MVDLSKMTKWDMGKLFDFSVLPKQSTEADIRRGCQIAKEYNCKAFCFSSSEWTPIVAEELKGTDIMVGAAIGFPFGQQSSAVKAFETAEAVRLGATVLDNCMNVGDLKDKKYDKILAEFKEYVDAAQGVMTKMIIETCFLTKEEIVTATKLVCEAGIDWVKQSSGWGVGGCPATAEDVKILKENITLPCRVKVSGKVNTLEKMKTMFEAGAELVGTSSGPAIVDGLVGDINAY